ncbi:MAG: OmpA family protein [Thermodesulfobacteriota bacterium]|nr:OmpA family protein [Thermodesulfobacteriota bacterium]
MRFQTALTIFTIFFTLMPVHVTPAATVRKHGEAETRLDISRMLYSYNYEYAQGLLVPTFVISSQSKHTGLIRAPKVNLAIKAPMVSGKKTIIKSNKKPETIKTIYFNFDSAELTQKAKKVLDSVTQDKQYKIVSVTGYTCPQGTAAHNRRLADRRAQAAAQYLRARGVTVKHVTGKEECYTKCNLSKNRRVVLQPVQ